ncbi:hypothetical protein WMF37_13255 [Sorangium sp. So ce291]|uniref:hypothetical protein n=1 Tax=Sorangium sp. So ce291 TaxID=3133294 RepID=UPI003F601F31
MAEKNGVKWLMAVYFPKGQKGFRTILNKFTKDLLGVPSSGANAMVFVTNQELTLAQRRMLRNLGGPVQIEIYHLERITSILDAPPMAGVRRQFLGIDADTETFGSLKHEVVEAQDRVIGFQTGGSSFCYWMLYHFDLDRNIARNFGLIRRGEFPLYDVRFRIRDMDAGKDVANKNWGEMNSPADFIFVEWPLHPSIYYRIFFHARNGSWHEDLILKRSVQAQCWLAAARVMGKRGNDIVYSHIDNGFVPEFGEPAWRS